VTGNATADVAAIQGAANQVLCVNNAGTALAFATDVISLTFVIDGGGSAISTGIKGDITIPFACTITEWTLLADVSGSIVVDVWKDTYANYPPTVADTITASAKPTVSSAVKGQSSTLTGWTTAVAAGDTIRFNVDSATTITRVTLSLKCTKQRS
jgi:molecular chaperone DnaK (HSP70)